MAGPNMPAMAWRNLWRNRRRTILTLVSIAFGTCLAILFAAMQDRNWADMIDLAARIRGGHVTLQHVEFQDTPTLSRTIDDVPALVAAAEADPKVRKATARVTGQLMLSTANNSLGAMMIAYDPTDEDVTTLSLLEAVEHGKAFTSNDDRGILLGKRLAKNLKVDEGGKVVFTLMDREGEIASGLARLSGVIVTGSDSLDGSLALLPLGRMQEVLDYAPDEATQVAVFAEDQRRSPGIAQRLGEALGGLETALTWDEAQPELAGFIAMKVGGSRVMTGIMILLVVAGIFNTLFVSVMERSREFGIMLAIGFSPRQLFGMVVWESFWLGLTGIILGGLVTLPPYLYLNEVGIDLSAMVGEGESLEVAGIGMSTVLRVGIFPESLVVILIGVLLATMMAGLYPAWRAGRVEPIESIYLV